MSARGIAFKPEEATDALKDYVGQVVETDYSEKPFGMEGAPEIKRTGKVLCLKIRTTVYDKEQYEWYPPSNVKKTKTGIKVSYQAWSPDWQAFVLFKLREPLIERQFEANFPVVRWLYFIEALNQCGAMKDISIGGATPDERMQSMTKSLLGMTFRFQEQECEGMVKEKGGVLKKFNVLLPVEYLGKKPIEAVPHVRQADIGETAQPGRPEGID